jgi:hypothetical protein
VIRYLVVGIYTPESGIEFQRMAPAFDYIRDAERFRYDLLQSKYFESFKPCNMHVLQFDDGKEGV